MPEISPKYNCEKDTLSKVGPRQASCQVMLVRRSEMAKCHAKVYDRSARANSAVNGLTLTEAGWTDVGENEGARVQLGGYPNSIASSPEFAFPPKQTRNWTQKESWLRGKQFWTKLRNDDCIL